MSKKKTVAQLRSHGKGLWARESKAAHKTDFPLLVLSQLVFYPENIIPLTSLQGLQAKDLQSVKKGELRFGVITRLESLHGNKEVVAGYGTEAVVTALIKLPNGDIGAMIKGLRRFVVQAISKKKFGYLGDISFKQDLPFRSNDLLLAEIKAFKALVVKYLQLQPALSQDTLTQILSCDDPSLLGFLLAPHLSLELKEKVALLGTFDFRKRLKRLLKALGREVELLQLSTRIQDRVKDGVHDNLRKNFLREQMQAIKKELGDLGGGELDEIASLKKSFDEMPLPLPVREVANKEIERLAMMHPGTPEYMIAWTYLQWIKDLPWPPQVSEEEASPHPAPLVVDLQRAQDVLKRHHFGLEKIKERILEFIAVLQHRGKVSGQILLFVGPPGVGKTSLGKSIAEALERPFVRVALGGVKDEAEIRGHRRTYIGSMPGKIIQAMKEARSYQPVILMDEIDKAGKDGLRDLSSALLEVFDPEQNKHFSDHYLGIPFDLSQVLFIATANNLREISPPLLDRMEVIELSGYTENEKVSIAQKHLIPAMKKSLALKTQHFHCDDDLLRLMIHYYTREAGVRQLSRHLHAIGRKVVKQIVEGQWSEQENGVAKEQLVGYLGVPRYFPEPLDKKLQPGVAIGLAYTVVGGDILYIESRRHKGKASGPNLVLTGSLGKVMQESAQAVFSFLLSHSERLQLDRESMEHSHVHIHLPDGATPKDGPSAGAALLCAMTSLFMEKALPNTLAMTGEITLRGQVLPVGGIKEKLLAAHRYGKRQVILPAANWWDLEDIPEDVLASMSLFPVQSMLEVLVIAGLIAPPPELRQPQAQAYQKGQFIRDFPFMVHQQESSWLYQ